MYRCNRHKVNSVIKHSAVSVSDQGIFWMSLNVTVLWLQSLMDDNKRLEDQVRAGENYTKQLNQEARDMMVASEALQTKQETLFSVSSNASLIPLHCCPYSRNQFMSVWCALNKIRFTVVLLIYVCINFHEFNEIYSFRDTWIKSTKIDNQWILMKQQYVSS